MSKTTTFPDRVAIRLYADRELIHLLRKMAGAEQQQQPGNSVTVQTVLRKAVLEYANRNYPKMVPKRLEAEVA